MQLIGGVRMLKKVLILVSWSLWTFPSYAADIPRNGEIKIPTKEEAISICKKNPYIDSNFLLLGCVQQEQASAKSVLQMLDANKTDATNAYWTCVKNPYIDTFMLLSGCMQQELDALENLR